MQRTVEVVGLERAHLVVAQDEGRAGVAWLTQMAGSSAASPDSGTGAVSTVDGTLVTGGIVACADGATAPASPRLKSPSAVTTRAT